MLENVSKIRSIKQTVLQNPGSQNQNERKKSRVSLCYRIHQLHSCRGVRPTNKCSGYDAKQSYDEVPVRLDIWAMWSTPSLQSLPDPFRLGMVTPERVVSMGQISFWPFNSVYQQNVLTNYILNIYIWGFGIKQLTMVDIRSNQTKTKQNKERRKYYRITSLTLLAQEANE